MYPRQKEGEYLYLLATAVSFNLSLAAKFGAGAVTGMAPHHVETLGGTSVNLNFGKYESIVARDDLPLLLGFDLLPSFYRPRNYIA